MNTQVSKYLEASWILQYCNDVISMEKKNLSESDVPTISCIGKVRNNVQFLMPC